ncbi:hypothetical protein PLESTF_001068800 [Pleodorina starrii]|nr:hypothetical protein PLESTM_001144200 [Pleodorina starrii]GLC71044.1 hypothetical protein PLESTF_001068800 [Pleodorina starrii]
MPEHPPLRAELPQPSPSPSNDRGAGSSAPDCADDTSAAQLWQVAASSPDLLHRFRACMHLASWLQWRGAELGLPAATNSAKDVSGPAWSRPEARDWVGQVLRAGECLARFGDVHFAADQPVSSREYAKLLQLFLEEHGAVLRWGSIGGLPPALHGEALVIRTLLETRCERYDLDFGRLVGEVRGQQAQEPPPPPRKSDGGGGCSAGGPVQPGPLEVARSAIERVDEVRDVLVKGLLLCKIVWAAACFVRGGGRGSRSRSAAAGARAETEDKRVEQE